MGRKKLNLELEKEKLLKYWANCRDGLGLKTMQFIDSGIKEGHIILILRSLRKKKMISFGLKRWIMPKELLIEVRNKYG